MKLFNRKNDFKVCLRLLPVCYVMYNFEYSKFFCIVCFTYRSNLMYRLLNTVGKSTLSVKSLPRSPVFNPITAINSNFKSLQPMSIRLQSTTKTVGNPNKKSLRSYSTQNEQENGWKSSPTSFARYWVTREVLFFMDIILTSTRTVFRRSVILPNGGGKPLFSV